MIKNGDLLDQRAEQIQPLDDKIMGEVTGGVRTTGVLGNDLERYPSDGSEIIANFAKVTTGGGAGMIGWSGIRQVLTCRLHNCRSTGVCLTKLQ